MHRKKTMKGDTNWQAPIAKRDIKVQQIRVLLALGLFVWVIFNIGLRYEFTDLNNPDFARYGSSLILLAGLGFSWFKRVEEHVRLRVIYLSLYAISAHICLLLYLNGLDFALLIGLSNTVLITSLFLGSERQLFYYLSYVLILSGLACFTSQVTFTEAATKFLFVFGIIFLIYQFLHSQIDTTNHLEVTRDLLKSLFKESHDALIVAEVTTGKILLSNERARTLFRTEEEEGVNSLADLFGPTFSPEHLGDLKSEAIKRGLLSEDREILTRTGHTRWGHQVVKIIRMAGKEHFYVRITDVTDRIRSERMAFENERKYKVLMEEASDGIYISNENGIIIEANTRACELFGMRYEQLIGQRLPNILAPEEPTPAVLDLDMLRRKGQLMFERYFMRNDGTVFAAEISAKVINNAFYQFIIRDITNRKRVEQALIRSESKFRALIDRSFDIVVILDDKYTVQYISSSVERILKVKSFKLMHRNIFDFIHKANHEALQYGLRREIVNYGHHCELKDIIMCDAEGNEVCFDAVVTNYLQDDVVGGIVLNLHNITDRKATEKKLMKANFELDSFVYKASHDLRAPLLSVLGLINIATSSTPDEVFTYLDLMRTSVFKLDQFIHDLTQFSRSDRLELKREAIDFEKLIDEVIGNLQFMNPADDITFIRNISVGPDFTSDPMRLQVIFNNLISNSIKYYDDKKEQPFIQIDIKAEHNVCKIRVADNGIGIEEPYLDRIFEMFYRATELSEGSGLGLYILKNAISKVGGEISVSSRFGEGTEFFLHLPDLSVTNPEAEYEEAPNPKKTFERLS
ncbi:PAS domain S-box protein [Roseivirga sp. BDSF3-8]|uniref:PAS domain S-box protein n=1 Tax=Roseivirga sp. BDSF3-8 TaxID=3241598 RepID=UPI003531A68C